MFIVFKLIKKMQKKMYCIINMNYLLIASVLVLISLLILGITFYFGNPKDNVDNVENVENVENVDIVDIDIDPLGDIEADENPEPVKNNIAVSGEPDINMEPEVISVPVNPPNKPEENVTSSPTPTTTPAKPLVPVIKKSAVPPPPASSTTTDEDVPVQPTPTTTPAQPLVPVTQSPQNQNPTPSFPRLLTDKERAVLKLKVNNSFPEDDVPNMRSPMDVYRKCRGNLTRIEFLNMAETILVNDADVKVIMDPAKISAGNASRGGFIPDRWEDVWKKTADKRRTKLLNSCGPEPTPLRAVIPQHLPDTSGETVMGTPGKFENEGGLDINNGAFELQFKPAKKAFVLIEHVDVHRADPVNKNGSITFKYQDGTSHKFTFVGNGGLRFRKADGTFGPNLGVGNVSVPVLAGMGLSLNSYVIECLRTTGRNTWLFTPLQLSKGLVGIRMSDNADWGGLRGVFANVQS
jgi:hypothetical protein